MASEIGEDAPLYYVDDRSGFRGPGWAVVRRAKRGGDRDLCRAWSRRTANRIADALSLSVPNQQNESLWKQAHDALLAFHKLTDPRTPHVVVVEKHKAYRDALRAAKAGSDG